jgi:redox-sensitive bicupin YhaK (pirin superfamily)
MKYRSIANQTVATEFQMGPMRVKQPLPTNEVEQVSPFVLLHHAGPDHHIPGKGRTRLNPHPHRGFEPVTFLFSGGLHHKDSLGNEGFLNSGDVQWMTAGSGVIHSEGPSEQFAKEGGHMELIQLWVNLPREQKLTTPKYQDIKKETIPAIEQNGFTLSLVAGEYGVEKGPASTFSPITAMMVNFEADAQTEIEFPSSHNVLVYVLEGSLESNSSSIEKLSMATYNSDGEGIQLKAKSSGKALLLAGEPINEPISSYGPFVMNYPGEIKQAVMDYEMGKMGVLES